MCKGSWILKEYIYIYLANLIDFDWEIGLCHYLVGSLATSFSFKRYYEFWYIWLRMCMYQEKEKKSTGSLIGMLGINATPRSP